MMSHNKAIFFDRDGVLNQSIVVKGKPFPPETLAELTLTSQIEATCTRLKEMGFMLFMMTNQPDIARGKVSQNKVDTINRFLKDKLKLDHVYCCPHDDQDKCSCRKPLAGMIYQAQDSFGIDLSKSYVVGDRWKDIQAGINSGCKTIFIDYNYDEKKIKADFNINSTSKILDVIGESYENNR